MPLISHRGAAHLAEANSLKAIHAGDAFTPDYVEVDINCSADGQLVIYHGSVRRFLRGKHTNETYAELKTANPHLMLLKDFLAIKINAPFIFDIKINDATSLKNMIHSLSRFHRQDFAFTSPHEHSLVAVKKAFPLAPTFQSQPYHHGPISALEIARKHNFEGVALNKWWMTPLVHRLCKAHGKKIICYTVDSAMGIKLIRRFFPDVYITTNRPDVYRSMFPND